MRLVPLLYCGLFLRPKIFTVDSSVYSTGPDSKQNTENDERKARMQAGRKGGREGGREREKEEEADWPPTGKSLDVRNSLI